MKKLILVFLIVPFIGKANDIKLKTKVSDITLYLTGAEATRKAPVKLIKGRNKIIFTGLSAVIDSKSIQFSADQPYDLVSVSTEMDYYSPTEGNIRIQKLEDSLQILDHKIQALQDEKNGYVSEKSLLERNKEIKGKDQNISVEEMDKMALFFRERMTLIYKKLSEYDLQIQKLRKQRPKYNFQISALNEISFSKSNQIIVIVDVAADVQLQTTLKYIVSNCGWQANYDLMASDASNQITLNYKAKVFNNTGNDWENVKMTLSSANPDKTASAPDLEAWIIDGSSGIRNLKKGKDTYLVPQNRSYSQYYGNSSAPQMNQELDGIGVDNTYEWKAKKKKKVNFTTIQVPQVSIEFEIVKHHNIPSDAKPYLVEINKHKLDATFSHKAVPKLDKDAFLLASIVGWEKYNLIPGPANVYYSNSYVGQSYLETQQVEDTLNLSFGRDDKISIKRQRVEEMSQKTMLGGHKKDTYTYEIIVKNNQSVPTQISLYDQIPISTHGDITVTENEISNAEYEEITGELFWNIQLQPGESKKVKLSYTIKYPKRMRIQVSRFRTISCPSF